MYPKERESAFQERRVDKGAEKIGNVHRKCMEGLRGEVR